MFACVCVYLSPRRFIKPRKISLTLFDVPRAGGRAAHAPLPAAQRKLCRTALSLAQPRQSQSAPKQYSQMANFTPHVELRVARE